MNCDNCKKELKKFALAIPEKAYGTNKCLLLCGNKCFIEKVKELQEIKMSEKGKKTMSNRNGICPFCGSLYEIIGETDPGHCPSKNCVRKSGDVNRIETQFTNGVQAVSFTSGKNKGIKTIQHNLTNGAKIIAGGTTFKTMAPIMDVSPAKAKKAEADSITREAKELKNEKKSKVKKTSKKVTKKVVKKTATKKTTKTKNKKA